MRSNANAAAKPAKPPQNFDDSDLSGQCLDGIDLTDRRIKRVNFEGTSLKRALFTRGVFTDCSFVGANLDEAVMRRAVFENCDFSNSSVIAADAQEAIFRAAAILTYAKRQSQGLRQPRLHFDGATLDRSRFVGARLVGATLHNVTATNVDFSNCDLRGTSFDNTKLAGSTFTGAKLQDANFSQAVDAREVLPEWARMVAKLIQPIAKDKLDAALASHQQWRDSNGAEGERLMLRGFDLSGVNFDRKDFSGADFRGARLDRASMRKVKMIATDLRDASLIGTDFSYADLRGALLSDNALRRAFLDDAQLDNPPPAAA